MKKPTKTISGITPVAIMLPPRKCNHGACTFCPNLNVPQSYTPKSPVVLRACALNYDSYRQVKARVKAFVSMRHPVEKIELIIMGGTFLEYPARFQNKFIKGCYDGLNSRKSKTLSSAKKLNEKSKKRCVALCIETRPDTCSEKNILKMRRWGATRVELGVQIIDNKIYKKVLRGHTVKDVIDATYNLRNAGFKVGYHIMPGLPGSNSRKDLKLFKKLFSNSDFKPDQLKIYPCQVMPGSALEKDYWEGKYKPYTKEQIKKLLFKMLKIVPKYCRVMRIMREIPPEYLVAGTINIDLRKDVEEELRKKDNSTQGHTPKNIFLNIFNKGIKEIRYREIGFAMQYFKKIDPKLKLKITKYKLNKGKEFFLEITNSQNILFGLLRLRIFKNKAIVRELHIYGPSLRLGEQGKISQHRGFGKLLLSRAEEIVRKNKINELAVISGVGVREYYKKLGYKLRKEYMIKSFN